MFLVQSALAFFALAMGIISAWVKRSPWIWGSFLIIACILAYFSKIIAPIALAPIGAIFVVHAFLKGDVKGVARFILVLLAIGVSLGLLTHKFPGFRNWNLVDKVQISPKGAPFSLWLNFDKPFIGIFVLVLGFPLVRNIEELRKALRIGIPLTVAGLIVMVVFALGSGWIKWDPKLPPLYWFFIIENLVFVSIIEEAFWRGFIQKELFRGFGQKGVFAHFACVFVTAFLFTVLHYFWIPNYSFLGLVFIAGLIYGSIFQITKALEASIFCHWAFNLTHFFLFTYPLLQNKM